MRSGRGPAPRWSVRPLDGGERTKLEELYRARVKLAAIAFAAAPLLLLGVMGYLLESPLAVRLLAAVVIAIPFLYLGLTGARAATATKRDLAEGRVETAFATVEAVEAAPGRGAKIRVLVLDGARLGVRENVWSRLRPGDRVKIVRTIASRSVIEVTRDDGARG